MSRRDKTHDIVKNALIAEGWTITDDPFEVVIGSKSGMIDLGAEKLIAATKGTEKIAVEIKSFLGSSTITDFYQAYGQFMVYKTGLKSTDPDRVLYLALPAASYKELLEDIFRYTDFNFFNHDIIVYELKEKIKLIWIK